MFLLADTEGQVILQYGFSVSVSLIIAVPKTSPVLFLLAGRIANYFTTSLSLLYGLKSYYEGDIYFYCVLRVHLKQLYTSPEIT